MRRASGGVVVPPGSRTADRTWDLRPSVRVWRCRAQRRRCRARSTSAGWQDDRQGLCRVHFVNARRCGRSSTACRTFLVVRPDSRPVIRMSDSPGLGTAVPGWSMIEDGAILEPGDDVILTGSPSSRLEVPLPCDSECRSAKPCRATWRASSRSASPRGGRPPSAPSCAPTTPSGCATSSERSWRPAADACSSPSSTTSRPACCWRGWSGPGPFTDLVSLDIEAVYVLPAARRRGLGHALLVGATTVADEAGATEMYSSPLPGARGMQRFLARLGFAPAASHRVVTTAALQRKLTHEATPAPAGRCAGRARAVSRTSSRGAGRPALRASPSSTSR